MNASSRANSRVDSLLLATPDLRRGRVESQEPTVMTGRSASRAAPEHAEASNSPKANGLVR